ncbi:DUF6256 family protein [Streptomyces sp. QH1-20]|uniref:DUF6256 family protein n=1 Tax=Streptomyces sp. QH1-20 TaxID=3240934 RepID=UPI00351341CA
MIGRLVWAVLFGAIFAWEGIGLPIMRRRPARPWSPARRPTPARPGKGWAAAFARQVLGTALGGYVPLMAVAVGYYRGVARLGIPAS